MDLKITLRPQTRWTGLQGTPTLGVALVVKNEEENLPHLFRSIAGVADEVVVVDTGSTDGTLAVCERWGVKVVREPWRNDFSFARNRSIREASARYLLWLDADERLSDAAQEQLRQLRDEVLPQGPHRAFALEIHDQDTRGEVFGISLQVRLFPRVPGVEFRGTVCEQVIDSLRATGVELARLACAVTHLGHADPAVVREKALRTVDLLRVELRKDPEDARCLVQVAQTLAVLGYLPDAERQVSQAIARVDAATMASLLAELYALRACYRLRAANRLAAIYDLERASELWPDWGFPDALLAELRFSEKRYDQAWTLVQRAAGASFAAGSISFPLRQVRRNLEWTAGRVLSRRGDQAGAALRLAAALELSPRDVTLRLELGQLLLDTGRFEEAREVLEPAGADEENRSRLIEICAALGLARAMTGDLESAGACLSPLLDAFAAQLGGVSDVDPLVLAQVMMGEGYAIPAKNLMSLCKNLVADAA